MVKVETNAVRTAEQRGPLVALAFWLCLIVSAALYAVCVLSPRFVEWTTLQRQSVENQVELIDLQNQIKHLDRVVTAIENDPDFAARLARSEFGSIATGGERIPLPPALDFDPRVPRESERPQIAGLPWYVPPLRYVAENHSLRMRGLAVAAALTLFAFLFLQERSLGFLSVPMRVVSRLASRYVVHENPPRSRTSQR